MKLRSACLLVLLLPRDTSGFQPQLAQPGFKVTTAATKRGNVAPSVLVCQMLINNNSFNSSSSSSSHSSHYFRNESTRRSASGPRLAHGLICPETIAIFEKDDSNPVIRRFVDTYHKLGPLACEDMLSDPKALPHLIQAIRDIEA